MRSNVETEGWVKNVSYSTHLRAKHTHTICPIAIALGASAATEVDIVDPVRRARRRAAHEKTRDGSGVLARSLSKARRRRSARIRSRARASVVARRRARRDSIRRNLARQAKEREEN
eukprot:30838-Pelagococcus_subviridis.AAC.11